MIIDTNSIKEIYKNTPEDIKNLKNDIAMMSLGLCGGTSDDFINYGNYKKVLKEYQQTIY